MAHTIPEEFLAGIDKAIDITDTNPTTQMPEFFLVEIPGCISLNISLNMQLFVELFEEYAFLKSPTGWLSDGVNIPPFSNNTVFDDTGIADKGVHSV
jgi:hypothetical protein